ncbi:hypothetical protein [Owenweeksia hongkongensis]|uniref:hypothetical protein n=1 Tax=Owenweeksia hongkongensis TaxID=253245 RepID=UPI003A93A0F8
MKKLTLLLALAAFSLSAKAQAPQKTQLTFDASVVYHPDNYFFGHLVEMGISPRKTYDLLPVFTGQVGVRDFIGRSSWFYEGNVEYIYTQVQLKPGELKFPDQIDPYYGFVLETDENNNPLSIDRHEHYHSLGLSFGGGYRWQNKKQTKKFVLPIGFKAYNTFWRKSVSETKEGKYSKKINKGFGEEDSFNDWLYYGLYFKPSYEFTLSKNKSPLSFALFADVSMVWDTWQDNTIFLFGGGLGVRYEL